MGMKKKGGGWDRFDPIARRRVHDEIDAILDGDATNQEKDRRLWRCWREAEAGGDAVAARIVDGIGLWGTRCAVADRARIETGVILDRVDGTRLNAPVRANAPVLDGNGAATGETQMELWWELPWAEFDSWALTHFRLEASIRLKNRGFRLVQRLHERFPQTETPGEACDMAGIDPRLIELA